MADAVQFAHIRAALGSGVSAFGKGSRQSWIRRQAGADWVVLPMANYKIPFHLIAHTMIEEFILPESLSRSAQDRLGLSRGGALQAARNHRQGGLGPPPFMRVIEPDHPGSERIKM